MDIWADRFIIWENCLLRVGDMLAQLTGLIKLPARMISRYSSVLQQRPRSGPDINLTWANFH